MRCDRRGDGQIATLYYQCIMHKTALIDGQVPNVKLLDPIPYSS